MSNAFISRRSASASRSSTGRTTGAGATATGRPCSGPKNVTSSTCRSAGAGWSSTIRSSRRSKRNADKEEGSGAWRSRSSRKTRRKKHGLAAPLIDTHTTLKTEAKQAPTELKIAPSPKPGPDIPYEKRPVADTLAEFWANPAKYRTRPPRPASSASRSTRTRATA